MFDSYLFTTLLGLLKAVCSAWTLAVRLRHRAPVFQVDWTRRILRRRFATTPQLLKPTRNATLHASLRFAAHSISTPHQPTVQPASNFLPAGFLSSWRWWEAIERAVPSRARLPLLLPSLSSAPVVHLESTIQRANTPWYKQARGHDSYATECLAWSFQSASYIHSHHSHHRSTL